MSLMTYPPAPAMIASSMACSSVKEVSMRQFRSGHRERRSRHSSMPLPSGSRTSSTAISGLTAGILRMASLADEMMAGVHCVHVFPQLSGGLVTT
ncbi:Uncharacterised protein [Mycobacteroides abscessus subsp. abscessus]|nr:Uncharacterised protein [Mycobacteroides abscessus subsp. abscessus]